MMLFEMLCVIYVHLMEEPVSPQEQEIESMETLQQYIFRIEKGIKNFWILPKKLCIANQRSWQKAEINFPSTLIYHLVLQFFI